MKAFLISAMQSSAGKTVMSCALMAALKRRGLRVEAFKSGPDYIDAMFHSGVRGVPSRNLELVLQGEQGARRSFAAGNADIAVLEGAMGYYDGLGGTEQCSAWDLANRLELPAFLVLRPKAAGLSLAAQVQGFLRFRESSRISGLLLTDCSQYLAEMLCPLLERECGIPVLGFLPPMEEARIGSRHLGLLTAGEIEDLTGRFSRIAEEAEAHIDLDLLLKLAAEKAASGRRTATAESLCRIAVARDEAFCFCYEDSLEALRTAGAELCFFSPLRDSRLPEGCRGLYLCGGYPELYAKALSENTAIRSAVLAAVKAGMPTLAECGGFLYLQDELDDINGETHPMCGALPGHGFRTERLVRFGYLTLHAEKDSLLFRAGEEIPAHEFHYWDSTACGEDLRAEKKNGKNWRCGYAAANLYAAFPHLHLAGELPLAERFVKACADHEPY